MSPVKSRREQYSDATKAALLAAATRRFSESGFTATSLEDVATDIQATRGTVYHHFTSKLALFQAVFEEQEGEMMRLVIEASASTPDPWLSGRAAMEAFLDRCCDPVYGRLVWQEAPVALGWRRFKECEEQYSYGLVEQQVKSLVDSGHLPPLPLEPMTRITFQLLGAAGQALAEADPADKARVRADYFQVITRMLEGFRA